MAATFAQLTRIAEHYGLAPQARMPEPWIGATSHVYPWGDVIIKVPHDTEDAVQSLRVDVAVARYARELGVQATAVVAFDESMTILPRPFALSRLVADAVPLASFSGDGAARRAAWEEAGRQLAVVHRVRDRQAVPMELRTFRQSPEVDPRPWVAELRTSGALTPEDGEWLLALLERLARTALDDEPMTLCHGDVNAANILVHRETGAFLALIDWAGAGWLDPAWDFAGVPLDVVPWLLAGHRSIAPLPNDATAEARICWCQVQTRLWTARAKLHDGPATPDLGRDLLHIRQFVATAAI